tara:strand:- start:182 stop:325 length:144 start_codon:yes stop_codon:yes gene_type:complete
VGSISELIWFDGKFVKHRNAKIPVTTHAIIMEHQFLKELGHIGMEKN